MEFEGYYKNMGFEKYPFRDRTAEKEDTRRLFIKPERYSTLLDAFDDKQTCIINGNRGTGKTIIIEDLKAKIGDKCVMAYITNFEHIPLSHNILNYYDLILQEITRSVLIYLKKNMNKLKRLPKDDKILISFLIQKYGEAITDSQLKEQIEDIQLSKWKMVWNFLSKPITKIFNYGSTVVTNFGVQLLTKSFGMYLPSINSEEVINIFPEVKFKAVEDFKSVEISYAAFEMITKRIHDIVGGPVIVFFDKFDEDHRIENDADALSEFLKDLLVDNKLLLNENIQLVIAVWEIAFKVLSKNFRRSKHFVFDIRWSKDYLIQVLNHRLQVYSEDRIQSLESMLDKHDSNKEQILELANGNPRDLWDILDNIIQAQFDIDKNQGRISLQAMNNGMQTFVSGFNFYEYYPKKKNARKNTNDVYSYITFLLYLHEDEFTNNEFRDAAGVGGSATNYITNMQKIGLIEKTDRKKAGGSIIYKIIDPKIIYAIHNKIEIGH